MKKITFLMVITAIFCIFGVAFAAPLDKIEPYDPTGTSAASVAETILGIIQWIGLVIAVAMVLYVGIKYLTSTAGKKAEAKETMVPVLIGAALLAIAPTIVSWIFTAAGGE